MFTINNPTMGHAALLKKLSGPSVKYAIFQKECGKKSTKHYQGYIELASNYRMAYVKKLLGGIAHLERRLGTASQARDYCRKLEGRLEGPFEHGVFVLPKPGKRNDLQDAVAELANHRSLAKLATDHGGTYVRYNRGFKRYLQVTATRRKEPPVVSLYFGDTGTGKTRKVVDENPEYFRKHPDNKWFDGYNEEAVLLLDDFSGASSKMSLNYVLQLLDRYPFTIEIKGDFIELQATTIIITTNSHPNTWYDYSKRLTQYQALARRIHHVWCFDAETDAFRVQHSKFFGTNPYQTPSDYRKIALKRPRLERQDAIVTCSLSTLEDSDLEDYSEDSELEVLDDDSLEGDSDDDEEFVRPKKRTKLDLT